MRAGITAPRCLLGNVTNAVGSPNQGVSHIHNLPYWLQYCSQLTTRVSLGFLLLFSRLEKTGSRNFGSNYSSLYKGKYCRKSNSELIEKYVC